MKQYLVAENTIGRVTVSESTIQEMILEELIQVVGVHAKEPSLFGKLMEPFSKRVKFVQTNEHLTVTVPIKVFYGTNVMAVAKAVQDRIQFALASMLGVDHLTIHIYIEGLILQD